MNHFILDLEEQLRRAATRAERVDIINELAHELRSINEERSIALTEEAFTISEELHYEKGLAYAKRNRGFCAFYAVEYDKALRNLFEAAETFKKLGDESGHASALVWTGIVFNSMGETGSSLDYFTQALHISEKLGDRRAKARILTSIGSVYAMIKDNSHAIKYFSEALEFSESAQDLIQKASALNGMGRIYTALGNFEKALQYEQEALKIRRESSDVRGVASSHFFMGRIYEKMGNPDEALKLYMSLFTGENGISLQSWKWGRGQLSLATAKLFSNIQKLDDAEHYANDALEIGVAIKAQKIEADAHQILARIFKKKENFKKAFEHLERYDTLNMMIQGEQLAKSARSLETARALRESATLRLKNEELARLNEELSDANEEAAALNRHLSETNQNLELLNREKNEFLGIAAHDLKNPLASIILTTDFLRLYRSKLADEEIDAKLNSIQTTAARMNTIVSNILDANAIENGQLFLKMENVDVAALLDTLAKEYSARAEAKRIAISVEDFTRNVRAYADQNAMYEVLENVLSNAVKYSPADTTVRVRVQDESYITVNGVEHRIRIEVQDEGPGISQSDRQHLFKKYSRLSAKPTGGESSTGLGLSIAKKIVEAMDGSISCESRPGHGATFIVELPAFKPSGAIVENGSFV
ncbi:MAG TPA: tetratricopeptide repeat-containing sensor histidine kinase [Patescibacteria group bacterium]|nr:tetratricopeptide repeat-containing sensor histidine kinase [Patescibacteria group bacterium]